MPNRTLQGTEIASQIEGLLALAILHPLRTLLLAGSICSFPGSTVWAQGNPEDVASVATAAPETGTQKIQPIPLEEVPSRAETTSAELDALLPRDIFRHTLQQVSSETNRALQEIEPRLAKTRQTIARRPNIRVLQRCESDLSEMLTHLRALQEELDNLLDTLRASLDKIDAILKVWQTTDEIARTQDSADATTMKRIAAVLDEIDQARAAVVKQRNDILAVRDKLVNPSVTVDESVQQVRVAVEARLAGIFQADHPPLWSPRVRESFATEWHTLGPQFFWKRLKETRQFSRSEVGMFGFQLLLFVSLGLGFRWLRERTRTRADADDRLRQAQLVFEHPWAMAVLTTALFTISLNPLAPRSAGLVAAVFIAFATMRIVQRYLPPPMMLFAWGLAVLFVLDRTRDLLDTTPTLDRLVFMAEMLGGLGILIWLLSPSRIAKLPEERRRHPFFRPIYVVMSLGAGLLAIAIVSDLTGWSDLAALLGDGVLRSGYLGLVLFVLLKVVQGLTMFALVLRPLGLVRAVSRNRPVVHRWLERGLSIVAVGFWAALVCGQLGLLTPATRVAKQLLDASIDVGALSVSLGDVVVFALTVWFSFLLARGVQVLLQEDVFSRIRTSRGVPYAVSNIARYSVICLGFLVGLSAAGVEVTKLAVVAGGLGVGIGFGLQNVVNNFVSGLILLFERPIDVGDTIEVSDTSGTMKRIGIRASVIRTFDGAEVIVPNGMLIADKVTNWTLSDRRRRVDLNVGVEYGTHAQRVIDLLVDVAKANPKVISDPEPVAFFENFGDSSLDFKLRAWFEADSSTNTFTIHSDIAVAVQQALDHAGIGVPFPQRDLHLIGMPAQAAAGVDPEKKPANA